MDAAGTAVTAVMRAASATPGGLKLEGRVQYHRVRGASFLLRGMCGD